MSKVVCPYNCPGCAKAADSLPQCGEVLMQVLLVVESGKYEFGNYNMVDHESASELLTIAQDCLDDVYARQTERPRDIFRKAVRELVNRLLSEGIICSPALIDRARHFSGYTPCFCAAAEFDYDNRDLAEDYPPVCAMGLSDTGNPSHNDLHAAELNAMDYREYISRALPVA
jgi:hypothetical protein